MKISLCLLTRNELTGCRLDVPRLPCDEFAEVYAVDGGSTDGTAEYLRAAGIAVHPQPKRGLNAAYLHAASMATGDAVVVFFPKGTIDPASLREFSRLLRQGCALVIASRMIGGARNEEDGALFKPRKWCVLALGLLASFVWRREGYRVRDVLHGVKGFRLDAFQRMQLLDHGLSVDVEMVVRSYRLRLPRAEFPVCEEARTYGQSNFRMWPTGKALLRYLWFELRRPL
jgi:glycosyltransferase involved in cell wall biosynthesis